MKTGTALTERVAKYRAQLRKQGLLPVPDRRSAQYRAEVKRTIEVLSKDPNEQEILDFIEQAQDYSGWR